MSTDPNSATFWGHIIISVMLVIAKGEDLLYRKRNGAERIRKIVREELEGKKE